MREHRLKQVEKTNPSGGGTNLYMPKSHPLNFTSPWLGRIPYNQDSPSFARGLVFKKL
jgi:hypothetical protein